MEIKQIIFRDNVVWNEDVEQKLNRFPIVLHSNQWLEYTNYHYHPGIEIHMTHDGEGSMVVGKQIYLQSPRSVLVFRGMVPHQMISKSSYKRTVISLSFGDEQTQALPSLHSLIDFSWIPEDSCLSLNLDPKKFNQLEQMCAALLAEIDSKDTGWKQMALSNVLQITVFLQRALNQKDQESPIEQSSNLKTELVQQVSDYVCKHLDEKLTLKAVAKKFSVSEAYLTRCFTQEMGVSFYKYLLLQRVAEGKRLLREAADVSITDIAYLTGFPSPSHFSRHFKQLTGETPSSYRKQ